MSKKPSTNGKPSVERADIFSGAHVGVWFDDAAKKTLPNLFDCLSARWRDGKCTRQAGRLRFSFNTGCLVVTLECPTEGLQTSLWVNSLTTALEEFESYLVGGKVNWALTYQNAKKHLPTVE